MSTILLVQTSAINCFYNLSEQLIEDGMDVTLARTAEELGSALSLKPFEAILINLEPDGEGGIQGIQQLDMIRSGELQQQAVCFAVSVSSAVTLLDLRQQYLPSLSVIAGWIDLPVQPQKSSKIIRDVIKAPGQLSIGARKQSADKRA